MYGGCDCKKENKEDIGKNPYKTPKTIQEEKPTCRRRGCEGYVITAHSLEECWCRRRRELRPDEVAQMVSAIITFAAATIVTAYLLGLLIQL